MKLIESILTSRLNQWCYLHPSLNQNAKYLLDLQCCHITLLGDSRVCQMLFCAVMAGSRLKVATYYRCLVLFDSVGQVSIEIVLYVSWYPMAASCCPNYVRCCPKSPRCWPMSISFSPMSVRCCPISSQI